jgi:predicted glycogen debranching enzyme
LFIGLKEIYPMSVTKPTTKTGNLIRPLSFGRNICGELSSAEATEWLVTNGIGGYASGTVASLLTRRYHGLLVAALKEPLGRTLLVSKLDETIEYDNQTHRIFSNRWGNILVEPHGYRHIERFRLVGAIPVWTYSFGDARLEKRIWMQLGKNTTYIFYRLHQAMSPMILRVRPLVNYRDFHGETRGGDWVMKLKRIEHGLSISAFEGAIPFRVLSDRAEVNQEHHWYRNFSLRMEQQNGFAMMEDHLNIGEFHIKLEPGESVTFVVSTETSPNLDGASALEQRQAHEAKLQALAPDMPAQLLLAADQFIVKRPDPNQPEGRSIIAGYPWLRDWARDTLISLPGLTLATGRQDEAHDLLKTFAQYTNQGMLPSCFPEAGESPEYKTADVTLWYFEAIRAYYQETGDKALLGELFPILAEIMDWHIRGTSHNIHVDPLDGLLFAGEKGLPLTWMDSKWGDWVVTPRSGKPVEINALWYNALCSMAEFAHSLDQPAKHYENLAKRTRASFLRFWNEELGFCYDVLDGPQGNDATLRPNQLLAVSLHHSPLDKARQKAVVDICARRLLIPMGLRSLAEDEPGYVGHYGGNTQQQLGAIHQGMAWGWLIGPFVSAHLRVYQNTQTARVFLEPFLDHLSVRGVGSVSEFFDGNPPYTAHGCIAQAWSVAELLRAWREIYPKNALVNIT